MEIKKYITISLTIIFCLKGAYTESNSEIIKNDSLFSTKIMDFLPGNHLKDMAIDTAGDFYFITEKIDRANFNIRLAYRSSHSYKYFLTKYDYQNKSIKVLDSNFIQADDIIFDNFNNMWIRGNKTIHKKEGNKILEVFRCKNASINCLAVDSKNNIWVGGFNTGLIKISNNLIVTAYKVDNSPIQDNGVIDIYIDKDDNIWACLWNRKGVVKLKDNNWFNYNVTTQNLWCITTDKDDNVWVGTGYDNPLESLKKFDGTKWKTENPKGKEGKIIEGAVRNLFSDRDKIWIVSEKTEDMAFKSNVLLTFDGLFWKKIETIPEGNSIMDIKIDYLRNVAWVRILNKGIIKIKL